MNSSRLMQPQTVVILSGQAEACLLYKSQLTLKGLKARSFLPFDGQRGRGFLYARTVNVAQAEVP